MKIELFYFFSAHSMNKLMWFITFLEDNTVSIVNFMWISKILQWGNHRPLHSLLVEVSYKCFYDPIYFCLFTKVQVCSLQIIVSMRRFGKEINCFMWRALVCGPHADRKTFLFSTFGHGEHLLGVVFWQTLLDSCIILTFWMCILILSIHIS